MAIYFAGRGTFGLPKIDGIHFAISRGSLLRPYRYDALSINGHHDAGKSRFVAFQAAGLRGLRTQHDIPCPINAPPFPVNGRPGERSKHPMLIPRSLTITSPDWKYWRYVPATICTCSISFLLAGRSHNEPSGSSISYVSGRGSEHCFDCADLPLGGASGGSRLAYVRAFSSCGGKPHAGRGA